MDISKYKYWIIIPSLIIIIVVIVTLISISVRTTIDNASGHPKIIIDHDGGADDALAIFMALLYEKYFNGPKVIALTTTHGNVDEDQTFINSQKILDIAERREVPIYRGSNSSLVISVPRYDYFGADGLGNNNYEPTENIEAQQQHAVLGIIELANKYPGEVTVLTLGALTNVALAVRMDPMLINKLAQVYVAAGNVYSENEPDTEYNAMQDVESYHVLLEKGNPEKVTILPFSQVKTPTVTREWRESVLGAIPTKIMKAQNDFERISIDVADNWIFLDSIAMGVILNETIIGDIKYSQNSIILCGDQRGINTNIFTTADEANVKVINRIIDEEYQHLLVSIFSAEINKK